MSIVRYLEAIRRGEVVHITDQLTERQASKAQQTLGHRADQPGLRGHSVGDTWPYRVVGKGDGSWEVHRNNCRQALVGLSCREAHKWARYFASTQRKATHVQG